MNRVIVSGNLTRDPELLTTASGLAICKFGIAVNERRKVNEEWTDVAHFFDVTYFGRLGELMAQKADKGDRVYVDGRLEYQSWENDAGEKRSKVAIVADRVEGEFVFLPSRDTPDAAPAAKPASKPAASGADDIPF